MRPITRITLDQLNERRWEVLALTCVGAFMAPLDGSIVAVALPVMSPVLRLSFGASMWVQAAYLLAMAVVLIPAGRLADQYGRVRFFMLGGLVVFTAGSLLAAASMSGGWLIAARAVQGAGGGAAELDRPRLSSPPSSRPPSGAAPSASTSWPSTSASASARRWAASWSTTSAGAGSSS